MTTAIAIDFDPVKKLRQSIKTFEQECASAGGHMPAIATLLRIYADELADKYPDDASRALTGGE